MEQENLIAKQIVQTRIDIKILKRELRQKRQQYKKLEKLFIVKQNYVLPFTYKDELIQ
jgi:hypothetical protein